MKISTFLTMALVLAGTFTLKAQDETVTYSDEFSNGAAYFTDGNTMDFSKKPDGCIWHGFKYNSGKSLGEHPCVVTKVAAADTLLVFQTKDGGWEGDHDSGAMLYRNVVAGVDFEAQVQLVGGDFTTFMGEGLFKYHNSAGIICRKVDSEVYDVVYLMFFDLWDIHHMIKSMDDGAQTEYPISKLATAEVHYSIAEYPWLKLKKVGTLFTAYTSKDGVEWIETVKVDRPDFEGVDMEIGLTQCNFISHNTEWGWIDDPAYYTEAQLDHFKLTHSVDGIPSAKQNLQNSTMVRAYSQANQIVVSSSKSPISKIAVYSIDGKLVASANNLKTQTYTLPMAQNGIYIVATETAAGKQAHKVSVNQ